MNSSTFLSLGRTTLEDMRSPTDQEWAKWSLMPRLPLWKAVALLCGFEPSSLPAEGVWLRASSDSPASDLRHRFEVAVGHQQSGLLPCRVAQTGFLSDLTVQTTDFADWAVRVGWPLPAELSQQWTRVPEVAPPAAGDSAGPWPWGSYETELLRMLARAATKFWADFDPSAPASADMNKAVMAWLQEQKLSDGAPVSERMAKAMATILRAPGLPSGPRSK
ncbi:hypothetical protein SNE35_18680 [Paucibacter sp. R3-3]|uniref:Uncharacterized protein n=1 Tax=Roseateles agri TaxID=3098619 RepID=A0ABU5DJS1_9BURK|nr:hypothetical protein [Paucibacter sp. R3-3]MDY0746546.1 hypothetical protein [Paucibacter sp. R3-3]